MTGGPSGVIRQLQSLYDSGSIGGLSDGELLHRFTTQLGDSPEVAFAAIVERHGPMVLGVCRRILRDSHQAQDAFQATFLILARKADSVRLEDSLGRWLHGVALRVACNARATSLKRKSREISLSVEVESAETVDPDRFELRAILDQELNRLPATYRAALVLCHLEGLSHEQAARQLGWPVGTLRSRLARGRDRLRGRLLRRGLAPAAVALAASSEGSAVTIDARLVDLTARSAVRFVQAGPTAWAIPAVVVSLTEEVLKSMFAVKMKMTTIALLAAGMLATGAALTAQSGSAGESQEGPPRGRRGPDLPPKHRQEVRPADEILADIDAIYKTYAAPNLDPGRLAKIREDPAALREYREEQLRATTRRDRLIWELYQSHPDHERVPKLLSSRWMNLHRFIDAKAAEQTLSEIDGVLAECKNRRLATDVAFLRAEFVMRAHLKSPDADAFKSPMPAIEAAIGRDPRDRRGAKLLMGVVQAVELPPETRDQLEVRILKDYPDSPNAAMILKSRRKREAVGKPFELEFTDAIRGAKISMKDLRGKVVVIDFWYTGCGPCVAEMPKLNALYAKYRDRGVEFIGVNADTPAAKGGLEGVKAFVEKHRIDWPQYFQGENGEGSFSDTWGVYQFPTVFVVDREGNLASVDARGKLDQLIPTLLESKSKDSEN